jgi:glycosyltransferase involved in cell wall biosynthesis
MRRVMMISEMFPPYNVSASHRAFQFAKHLPEFGYLPSVVSLEPGPDDQVDASLLAQLDDRIRLERIHHLGPKILPLLLALRALLRPFVRLLRRLRGVPVTAAESAPATPVEAPPLDENDPKYPGAAASLGKRCWHTLAWAFNFHVDLAAPMLLRAAKIHREDPVDLVWVTGPSSRSLLVGYWASRMLRRPLFLDIRDPWTYGSLWRPFSRFTADFEKWWARRILTAASRSVFTSPLTTAAMQARYPGAPAAKMSTLTNGHIGESGVVPRRSVAGERFLMSYVGSLNPRRRPDVLLDALQRACQAEPAAAHDLRLQFVGGMAGHEAKIEKFGVQEQVVDLGPVSHFESVAYMRGADVNVLLQTIAVGQDVIAGKTFEYLAARRPILGVVAPDGGDAWLMREARAGAVVSFEDPAAVAAEMLRLWRLWRDGALADSVAAVDIEKYSRRHLTGELAGYFDEVLRAEHG